MAGLLAGCKEEPPKPHVNYDPATAEFFVQDVQPIFRSNCFRCHGGMNRKGDYSMQTAAALMRGGKHGVAVVPGDPAGSLLVRLIRHEGAGTGIAPEPGPMPNKKKKLSDADIAIVERWVKAGAIMPPDKPLP
jgi:mono/diheme cytochrome c family protein